MSLHARSLAKISVFSLATLALAGCSPAAEPNLEGPIIIGQTTLPRAIDPVSTYSSSDFEIMYQIYPTVLNTNPSEAELRGDIASSFEFISPREYQVTIKDGLKFANGNTLDASDVVFSMNRLLETSEEGGPQALLGSVVGARQIDSLTLIYDLAVDYDQTFPYILSSVPGLVLDEEVFPQQGALSIDEIVETQPFAGPYVIDTWQADELLSLKPNPEYQGLWGTPKNSGVIIRYFNDSKNMLLSAERGEIDIAVLFRSTSAVNAQAIAERGSYQLVSGQGAEPGFLSFNLATQPYGFKSDQPDSKKARAIRQGVATVLDRAELSEAAYSGTYRPAFSTVPSEMTGSFPAFQNLYENLTVDDVRASFQELGVEIPVSLSFTFTPERYGEDGGKLPFLIKDQLERTGLFSIDLEPLDWSTLREVRKTDDYQMVLLFWGPDFGEADNYLTPLYSKDGWLFNHYENPRLSELLLAQLSEENVKSRLKQLAAIQQIAAEDAPLIPLLEGGRSALVKDGISGVSETFDSSFKFRYANIARTQ